MGPRAQAEGLVIDGGGHLCCCNKEGRSNGHVEVLGVRARDVREEKLERELRGV